MYAVISITNHGTQLVAHGYDTVLDVQRHIAERMRNESRDHEMQYGEFVVVFTDAFGQTDISRISREAAQRGDSVLRAPAWRCGGHLDGVQS